LQAEAPQIAAKALERLKSERTRALAALPAKASKQLDRIPFFLMYGPNAKGGGRNNGLEYIRETPRDNIPSSIGGGAMRSSLTAPRTM